ncbi:MAG: stress responsive protein [Candidatus Arcticimaribacter sp.]|nr:MAG: stress responsive protein [Candidatus Arcticimaribacter sp.]
MRSFLLLFLITTTLTTIQAQDKKANEPLIHTVLFWLKSPESKPDRIAFETAIQKLIANNPQKISGYLGKPANTEARGVVDPSFTYLYQMTFADATAEAAYQIDPTHLAFIAEAKHLWEKVIVYDAAPIE